MCSNKEIIIFGAGKEGMQLCNMIKSKKCLLFEEYEVKYFCDNYIPMGSFVDGIKVISANELKKIDRRYDIYICSSKHLDEIMKQLKELNIENEVYFVPEYVYEFKYNDEDMPLAVKMDINKPRIPWVEIEVVRHCNMNCNGCSTCANISDKECISVEKFESDIKQLKKLFSGIKVLKLFGGEPLLHNQLDHLISNARKNCPDSRIIVHSNGLLISKCDKKIFKLMSNLSVEFYFTLYPETGKLKRLIELELEKNNVKYDFTQPVYEFRKMINKKGDYDAGEVFANCCKCISLTNGVLSCNIPYLIDRIEKKYNVSICEDKYKGSVDIYNTDLNGWQINKLLNTPYNLCSYCAFMRFNIKDDDGYMVWKREKPALEDWII